MGARVENKLLFIHIGYIACHWCVSKTRLSFEYNDEVADFINQNFIPILIDKDERPDLERYYSNIVQEVDQLSNWSITSFALFDGTPVFGTTYLSPEHLLEVAENVLNTFKDDPLNVLEVAKDLSDSLIPTCPQSGNEEYSFSERDIHIIVEPWKRKFDKKNGRTLYPPEYPLAIGKEFLLEYAYHFNDEVVLKHIKLTLDKMAEGGLYDHINGGFFHYTKDAAWRCPFYEKQLMDNAVSINLCAKAQQYIPSPLYKKFIEETLQFSMRHLLAIDGGFHSSIQADPLGRESSFYTWTIDEFEQVLGDDAKLAIKYYGLKRHGSNDYRNTLYVSSTIKELSNEFSLSEKDVEKNLANIRAKLIKAFNSRAFINPDDKVITSANAMIAKAYISGYRVLGYEEYLLFANETLNYIRTRLMTDDGRLVHFIRNGKVEGEGLLDDYAHTIDAFINMYLVDGNEQWIFNAKLLADYTISKFFDPEIKMFLNCERNEKNSKIQTMPVADGAFPSGGSVMLHCLAALGLLFQDGEYKTKVKQLMYNMKDQLPGSGPYCANWTRLLFCFVKPHHLIAIVVPKAEGIATKYLSRYHTDTDIVFINKESKLPLFAHIQYNPNATEFYLYEKGVFKKKLSDLEELESLLRRE
ncbi:MAG: DUF255 domain-containing protein [Prevotellaceae bacterium]|jgi:uncharacterized protein YyaL (SSP411 family)|nr:DUF255 domain-containing protein [Prevotellaceae bacterium]